MPELPEVETVVRGLRRCLPGRVIRELELWDHKPIGTQPARFFLDAVRGRCFERIERLGKYLLFRFREGSTLVGHLRMTGKFIYLPRERADLSCEEYVRVVFHLDGGDLLLYRDMRRFGTLRFYDQETNPPELARLGPDALAPGLDSSALAARMATRRVGVKQLLLDQTLIAGVGNIYACEALFRAGLDPRLPGHALQAGQVERLLQELRTLLREAIRNNGTTIDDFRSVEDKSGRFQNMLRVYGRAGQPCRVCGTAIDRIRQGQRSTFFCPHCQDANG